MQYIILSCLAAILAVTGVMPGDGKMVSYGDLQSLDRAICGLVPELFMERLPDDVRPIAELEFAQAGENGVCQTPVLTKYMSAFAEDWQRTDLVK